MAFLPPHTLQLTGGCFCNAIRYAIDVPELASRPLIPTALPTPLGKDDQGQLLEAETRLPLIGIDHCQSCRRSCGGLIQCWFIAPVSWVRFQLKVIEKGKSDTNGASHDGKDLTQEEIELPTIEVVGKAAMSSSSKVANTALGVYSSSEDTYRTFCKRCGTTLTFCYNGDRGPEWTLGDMVDVSVGTLDKESLEMEGMEAERHGWWDDGTPWIKSLVWDGSKEVNGCGLIRHPAGVVRTKVED